MNLSRETRCLQAEAMTFASSYSYELGNNISSKVLAFAFSLSAEIERSMISSRTKEALARKKHEGKRLGRPKGKLSSVTKLTGKDDLIREYLVAGAKCGRATATFVASQRDKTSMRGSWTLHS
jgi:DNA invertase Pin-like site-specific DNA recombinase